MSKAIITVGFLVLLLSQRTLDNDAVLALSRAGFPEGVIISAIHRAKGSYDTSVDGLIALKRAGVTNGEIWAIVQKVYPQTPDPLQAPPAAGAPAGRKPLTIPGQSQEEHQK